MITMVSLDNIHYFMYVQKLFPHDGELLGFTLNNFQIYHTAALTVIMSLYMTS